MAVRSTQGRNRAARSTQGDVTFLFKTFILQKLASSPFTQTWVCLSALSFYVNVSVYVKVAKAQKIGLKVLILKYDLGKSLSKEM